MDKENSGQDGNGSEDPTTSDKIEKKLSITMGLLPSQSAHSVAQFADIKVRSSGALQHLDLQVQKAAVIDDPVHPKAWASKKIKIIFIYWISMLVLAAALNAVIIFTFHILPQLYSTVELKKIFLGSPYVNSIVGVVLAIILSCFYAFYILAYPDDSKWRSGNLRWAGFLFFNCYICWCLVGYINGTISLVKHIDINMHKDVKIFGNLTTAIIRTSTENYFSCCGVTSYRDWDQSINVVEQGYPKSCCNPATYPICAVPIHPFVKMGWRTVHALHEGGCLIHEVRMARGIACIIIILSGTFVVSSIIMVIIMGQVLTYLDTDIHLEQANPFFD